MILLVDIGNTRIKYIDALALTETPKQCLSQFVEHKLLNIDWLNNNWLAVTELVIANVSHKSVVDIIRNWAIAHNISLHLVESEQQKFGISSFYHQPKQLGVDRWLTLLAAASLYPNTHVLIVDAGTATTIDCLNAKGQHLGGWILPGINIIRDSLLNNTAQIKANFDDHASLAFGASSSENVNNACWAATVGAIELGIRQSETLLKEKVLVLLTGGNAHLIKSLIKQEIIINEQLVFHGLYRYSTQ